MKVVCSVDGVDVTLSRRNLVLLLQRLDEGRPAVLMTSNRESLVTIYGEEDDTHYEVGGRIDLTEPFPSAGAMGFIIRNKMHREGAGRD